jgi:hypothetical protein
LDHLDLVGRHGESVQGEDIAKVLGVVGVELALFWLSIEAMFPEVPEDFLHMLAMVRIVIRIDEDVVKIYDDANIEEIAEDVVYEALESGGSIRKSEGHDQPPIGAIASVECGLPFVSIGDPDEMISMAKVDLGVYPGPARSIQEVRNEREWIAILPGNAIKAPEVHAGA